MRIFLYSVALCALLSSCKKGSVTKAAAPFTPLTIVNQGVPGNTVEDLMNRISSVITQKPNLVIVMIGTNDVLHGNATYNSFGSTLSLLIDSLKATGSAVMLLTPPPVATWNTYNMDTVRLASVCATIKAMSETKKCYFVDINTNLAKIITAANSHQMYITDGLHPSAMSYTDISSYISIYIQANNIRPVKIVCFGDSITYGWTMIGEGTITGNTYPALLKNDLNTAY